MIPYKVEIFGFKRFEEASVILDKNLIAFVGPNEAGKTSFFKALLSIENNLRFSDDELTKDFNRENDLVIRIDYLLEHEEKNLLEKHGGSGRVSFYRIEKSVSGNFNYQLIGNVQRQKKSRFELKTLIEKLLLRKRILKIADQTSGTDNQFTTNLENLNSLDWKEDNLSIDFFDLLESINQFFENHLDLFNSQDQVFINDFYSKSLSVIEFEKKKHPSSSLLEELHSYRPSFVEFTNQERQLKGFYNLNELKQKPIALVNLLQLAQINISEIINAIEKKNDTKRIEIIDKANKTLKNKFSSWSQSEVFPRIHIEINSLKIVIDSEIGINHLKDRSDGLRQYISMKAFLEKRQDHIKPILLIDEAEMHLHYSAQANLVQDFEKQQMVNSIYYTTHSAGCLPSDLGTGIRVLEPLYFEDKDSGKSIIRNSIWRNDAGFSPLLLAMGASIFAFTPARKAIIAEGPSDTILLPRIFREGTGKKFLDFQVAPGIATVSKEAVLELELEAAKEVFLVDGDEGGTHNKEKLIQGGIGEKKIFQLPFNTTTEDFIKPEILANTIKNAFENMGYPTPNFDLQKVPPTGRIKWFENECKKMNNGFPEKVRIAEAIVSNIPSNEIIFDKSKSKQIQKLYLEIEKALT